MLYMCACIAVYCCNMQFVVILCKNLFCLFRCLRNIATEGGDAGVEHLVKTPAFFENIVKNTETQ